MKIKDLKLEELTPYENNPRDNEAAVSVVAASIKEFGFKVPIVADKDGVIVTGHTRLKAAQELGLETVPVIFADDLTPEQIKAFRLADNKTAEFASWDLDKLAAEMAGLEIDMEAFGFTPPEKTPDQDTFDVDEALEEAKANSRTKPGDLWKLGRHRLLCGDSTKRRDTNRLMAGFKAKLVITDPPYNVDYTGKTADALKIKNDKMTDKTFKDFLAAAFSNMYEAMANGAPIYVFHADTETQNFRAAFKESGLKLSQNLIWVKNTIILGHSDYQWKHEPILYGWKEGAAHFWFGDRTNATDYEDLAVLNPKKMKKEELVQILTEIQAERAKGSTIIYHDKPSASTDHPTMKPVKLLAKLIFNSSERGDLLFDPFGGSGSTLIAAEQTARTCYTIELDPAYCDVIIARYEALTGDKAEKVNG